MSQTLQRFVPTLYRLPGAARGPTPARQHLLGACQHLGQSEESLPLFLALQGISRPPGPLHPSLGQAVRGSKKSRSPLILPGHLFPAKMVHRAASRWLRSWVFTPHRPIPASSSDPSLHGLSPAQCCHAPNQRVFPQDPPVEREKVPEPPGPADTPQKSLDTDPGAVMEVAEPEQASGETPVGEHLSPGGRQGCSHPWRCPARGLFSQCNVFLLSLIQPFRSPPCCFFARHGRFPVSSLGLQSPVVSFGF